jgi:hypothetical protein
VAALARKVPAIGHQLKRPLREQENYSNWVWEVQIVMEEHGVWTVVNDSTQVPGALATSQEREDYYAAGRRAKHLLAQNVEEDQMVHLKAHELLRDAWAELARVHRRKTFARRAHLWELLRPLSQNEGKRVVGYVRHAKNLAEEQEQAGDLVSEDRIVLAILGRVLEIYCKVATVLQNWDS